ncbi:MAG: hypothetical protein PUF50_01380 [Erysipelotrichaceae bacterium]|nr:hypothetical protein [Erysipelotrichaceae bacterium]
MNFENELHALLDNSKVGIEFFADVLKKAESDKLREKIFAAFEMCKHHEQGIYHHLGLLEYPIHESCIKTAMNSLLEKMKNLTLNTDEEIKDACIDFLMEGKEHIHQYKYTEGLEITTKTLLGTMHEEYLALLTWFQKPQTN